MCCSLGKNRSKVDFDAAAWHEQAAYLHRGARRRRREEFLPYLVEVVEVVEVSQEDLRLDHVVERHAGRLEHAPKVLEDVARLLLDVGAVEGERGILPRLRRHARL